LPVTIAVLASCDSTSTPAADPFALEALDFLETESCVQMQ